MTLFLSPEEVRELTGYCRPSKQVEWLRREGMNFRIAADGHPRVLLDHVNQVLGGLARQGNNRRPSEPDFSVLVA
ncbi:DUF4224 domain-containing protein [Ferrovum sp.]|uniref:DUF4224 domain-containing protein n=1 Tax=Ferrovum sp. TaxID=2609467 RepID=UPI00344F7F52